MDTALLSGRGAKGLTSKKIMLRLLSIALIVVGSLYVSVSHREGAVPTGLAAEMLMSSLWGQSVMQAQQFGRFDCHGLAASHVESARRWVFSPSRHSGTKRTPTMHSRAEAPPRGERFRKNRELDQKMSKVEGEKQELEHRPEQGQPTEQKLEQMECQTQEQDGGNRNTASNAFVFSLLQSPIVPVGLFCLLYNRGVNWIYAAVICFLFARPISNNLAMQFAPSMVGLDAPREPLHSLAFVQGDMEGPWLQPGTITVLESWATWCKPCRNTIPYLNRLYRKYKNVNVRFVGIAQESEDEVRQVITELGSDFTYPVAIDNGEFNKAYQSYSIPTAFVVDTGGKVVWQGNPVSGLDAAIMTVLGYPDGIPRSNNSNRTGETGPQFAGPRPSKTTRIQLPSWDKFVR